ncbi:ATP-binding protein [Listeria booriae]|uniref:ATP-binding protein n=2 Tax=Listeria booriae TaxID=1552123 RepID=A0A841YP39_9LIST|nr:ATP-binding protein [Listeria booriae]MBC1402116.1 ATP-binding protein [Listeria booriae]
MAHNHFPDAEKMISKLEKSISTTSHSDPEYIAFQKRIAEEDRELARRALKSDEDKRMRKIFSESLINPLLEKATFENYTPDSSNELSKRAKYIVEKYATNFELKNPQNLLLSGNYGTGKSHLSVAAMKRIALKNFPDIKGYNHQATMMFISTPKLMTKIRESFNSGSDFTEAQLLDEIGKVDLLVMDDIGREIKASGNDFTTQKIFEIVESRQGKHTIYTSNFTEQELMTMYGEAIFSRMIQSTTKISFDWENYRLKGIVQK